jgi:hypothetical protein
VCGARPWKLLEVLRSAPFDGNQILIEVSIPREIDASIKIKIGKPTEPWPDSKKVADGI